MRPPVSSLRPDDVTLPDPPTSAAMHAAQGISPTVASDLVTTLLHKFDDLPDATSLLIDITFARDEEVPDWLLVTPDVNPSGPHDGFMLWVKPQHFTDEHPLTALLGAAAGPDTVAIALTHHALLTVPVSDDGTVRAMDGTSVPVERLSMSDDKRIDALNTMLVTRCGVVAQATAMLDRDGQPTSPYTLTFDPNNPDGGTGLYGDVPNALRRTLGVATATPSQTAARVCLTWTLLAAMLDTSTRDAAALAVAMRPDVLCAAAASGDLDLDVDPSLIDLDVYTDIDEDGWDTLCADTERAATSYCKLVAAAAEGAEQPVPHPNVVAWLGGEWALREFMPDINFDAALNLLETHSDGWSAIRDGGRLLLERAARYVEQPVTTHSEMHDWAEQQRARARNHRRGR